MTASAGETTAGTARRRLTAGLRVPLPADVAFRLFTARGEQEWAPGWSPRFPHPAPDDTVPGTVFETEADGRTTTWMVIASEPGRRISYARVTPSVRAGTVTVTLVECAPPDDPPFTGETRTGEPHTGEAHTGETHTEVTVTYDLTALNEPAVAELHGFAEDYPDYIRSWEALIAARFPA